MNESFDDQRFLDLMNIAGPANALELAMRLDEDLSRIAATLVDAAQNLDAPTLRAQSHVLLAISGTVGANQLYLLAERLNRLARGADTGPVTDLLADIRHLLDKLIQRVRVMRANLVGQP